MQQSRIPITRGDTYQILITARREDGTVLDLAGATDIRFTVKTSRSSGSTTFTRNFGAGVWAYSNATGRIVVELGTAQTLSLDPTLYYVWDIQYTHPTFGTKTIETGTFIVERDIYV